MKKLSDMLDELVETQTQLPANIYFKFSSTEETKYMGILHAIINETMHIKFLNRRKKDKSGEWIKISVNVHRSEFRAEIDHENTEHYVSPVDDGRGNQ